MRAVVQRVSCASVSVQSEIIAEIGKGLLAYVGAMRGDGAADVAYTASKIFGLRIFEDEDGRMARSVAEVGGAILLVPQFTLLGDVRRGRRPSFDEAEAPERARILFEELVQAIRSEAGCLLVQTGRFREAMTVRAAVDGPVTILIDSRRTF